MTKLYPINIDLSEEEQRKLKRFVGAAGYKSVRVFVREAIMEKMGNDLKAMPADQRKALQSLITPLSDSLV